MLNTLWAGLLNPKDSLMVFRQKSWDQFETIGLPRPKQEAFQYLSKKLLFPSKLAERKQGVVLPAADLVWVDGFLEKNSVADPLVCLPLDSAMRSYGLFLQSRFAKLLAEEKDPFAALNGAFQGRGAFLYVPPKCKAALDLMQVYTDDGFASPRLHVYLGRGAQLQLTQRSQGVSSFCNSLIDVVLDEGSELSFIDHAEGHFQAMRATLKRDSRLKAVLLGQKTRVSAQVQLTEANSETALFGLAHLDGNQEAHIHTTVAHIAPHTRSRQHFKSVLREKSRFSFEGKIHVLPAAQKTEAYQLNNNLLLSPEAVANAKPNLEIFADDVKASHGATVGQLDREQLFYLRSRGLNLEQARKWLIEGFCKEIFDHAK